MTILWFLLVWPIVGVAWGAISVLFALVSGMPLSGLTWHFIEGLHPVARFAFFLLGCTFSDLGSEVGMGQYTSRRAYPYGTGVALGLVVGILAVCAPGISFFLFLASLAIIAAPFAVRLQRGPFRPNIRDLNEALDAVYAVPPSRWTVHFHVPGPLAQFFDEPYLYLESFASDGRRLRLIRFQHSGELLRVDDAEADSDVAFSIVAKRHRLVMQQCRDSAARELSQGRNRRVNRVICSLLDGTLKLLP